MYQPPTFTALELIPDAPAGITVQRIVPSASWSDTWFAILMASSTMATLPSRSSVRTSNRPYST